jgi:hypothetical protein
MTMQIIIQGDGTLWLFTGVGATRMLAIADACRKAREHVEDFIIKDAYEARKETQNAATN